jgi:hypothetical protein
MVLRPPFLPQAKKMKEALLWQQELGKVTMMMVYMLNH